MMLPVTNLKLIAAYLFVAFVSGCITIDFDQRSLFTRRDAGGTVPVDSLNVKFHHASKIQFPTQDNLELNGVILTYPDLDSTAASTRYIIFFGGNDFLITQKTIDIFDRIRCNILLFNYRGFGDNPGVPSIRGIVRDGAGAHAFLTKSLDFPRNRIFLMGHSIGSYVALSLAQIDTCGGIILDAPFTNFTDLSEDIQKEFPSYWKLLYRINFEHKLFELDNLSKVKQIRYPILMLARENDDFVPVSRVKVLFHYTLSREKHFTTIKNASHNTIVDIDEYTEAINTFIEQLN
ncbi:MAG: lysophospholipase [Candidatus Marinimicrobia bacterium]|nr:lysophospholipase [Candidatus Neomarinimicrobiota bacterium]